MPNTAGWLLLKAYAVIAIAFAGRGDLLFDLLFEDLKNGKEIAAIINLPEPNLYTGHCWRSTSSMWAANAGCSIGQIKALKGHKVDTAVQGCIQLSDIMRHKVADAVILSPKSPKTPSRM